MNEFFQERAALYVSGMMTAQEREEFELVLEFDDELRAFAAGLSEVGADGLVQWINPAFTAMCGYTLDDVRGKKLGPILQGEKTDRQAADRMRLAVRAFRPCREVILNYRKNGEPYFSDIAITPIFGGEGQPLLLAAREREVADLALA
jgi:PAS domain S-box-containing protein